MNRNARIVRNACWPYSGRKFSVWMNNRAVLETDDLDEAHRKQDEIEGKAD